MLTDSQIKKLKIPAVDQMMMWSDFCRHPNLRRSSNDLGNLNREQTNLITQLITINSTSAPLPLTHLIQHG
jgi:hypothetical protein